MTQTKQQFLLETVVNNNFLVWELILCNSVCDYKNFEVDRRKKIGHRLLRGIILNNMGVLAALKRQKDAWELFTNAMQCFNEEFFEVKGVIQENFKKAPDYRRISVQEYVMEVAGSFIYCYLLVLR